jgi:hypothetical protein
VDFGALGLWGFVALVDNNPEATKLHHTFVSTLWVGSKNVTLQGSLSVSKLSQRDRQIYIQWHPGTIR